MSILVFFALGTQHRYLLPGLSFVWPFFLHVIHINHMAPQTLFLSLTHTRARFGDSQRGFFPFFFLSVRMRPVLWRSESASIAAGGGTETPSWMAERGIQTEVVGCTTQPGERRCCSARRACCTVFTHQWHGCLHSHRLNISMCA